MVRQSQLVSYGHVGLRATVGNSPSGSREETSGCSGSPDELHGLWMPEGTEVQGGCYQATGACPTLFSEF